MEGEGFLEAEVSWRPCHLNWALKEGENRRMQPEKNITGGGWLGINVGIEIGIVSMETNRSVWLRRGCLWDS